MGRLDGKVAVITGAASGIGAACALRFAEEGASIAGLDIQDAPGPDYEAAVKLAAKSHYIKADVRDRAAVDAAIDEFAERVGAPDILINSAGVAGGGAVHMLSDEDWDKVVDINLKGTFIVSRAVLPKMIESGGGNIVNIASVEGLEGFEGGSAYNASKGGVVILTKNMAIDYARKGVRVNAICPGFIETPMFQQVLGLEGIAAIRDKIRDAHQLGRFGEPREIANAALFLASDEASFVTGHPLVVDGGFTAGHRFGIGAMMGLE
jgi:NAD(P)-dependent dehydrogenase (short-subunit alcohol dehydrogenase family)